MDIFILGDSIISEEEMKKNNIKSISIISETDILHPRLIVKYNDGIKKYSHVENIIDTDKKFREFLEVCIPELKK